MRFARAALVVVLFCAAHAGPAAAAAPIVDALQVDHTTQPLGIDNPQPSLSWKLAPPATARADGVSGAGRLEREQAAAGPAGRLGQRQGQQRRLGRRRLRRPRARVVRAATTGPCRSGTAPTRPRTGAAPTWFETGLLAPADWGGARWITPDAADQRSWADFTLDADFTLKSGAAGFLFRAADSSNFYMWQVNAVSTAGKVLLRPHANVGGRFSNIAEIDLAPLITPANATAAASHPDPGRGQHDHDVDRRDPGRHPHRHRDPQQGHDRLPPVGHQRRGRDRRLRQPGRARPRRHRRCSPTTSRPRPTPRSRRRRWSTASSSPTTA